MNHAHVIALVGFNANLQVAHWQADTTLNTHRVLGELYDGMVELTDKLAEVAMGKDRNTDFPEDQINITTNADYGELFKTGFAILGEILSDLTPGSDDDLLNIVADMSAAMNRTAYLLKLG